MLFSTIMFHYVTKVMLEKTGNIIYLRVPNHRMRGRTVVKFQSIQWSRRRNTQTKMGIRIRAAPTSEAPIKSRKMFMEKLKQRAMMTSCTLGFRDKSIGLNLGGDD
jgi:hypothetical protein